MRHRHRAGVILPLVYSPILTPAYVLDLCHRLYAALVGLWESEF